MNNGERDTPLNAKSFTRTDVEAAESGAEVLETSDLSIAQSKQQVTDAFDLAVRALSVDHSPTEAPGDKSQPSGRDTRGRFASGNEHALGAGLRRYQLRGALPDDVRASVEAWGSGLLTDRGGADELSAIEAGYCRRLTQLEGALELLGQDIAARGVMSARGRPRATYRAFLDTLATWDRLAQRLGLGRKPRQIETIQQLMHQPTTPKGSHHD